jgi:hypothetical protein
MIARRSSEPTRLSAEAKALEYAEFLSARIAEAGMRCSNYRYVDYLTVVGLAKNLVEESGPAPWASPINSRIVGFYWLLNRTTTLRRLL